MILRYSEFPQRIFSLVTKKLDMMAAQLAGINNRWIISDSPRGPFTNAFINHYELINYVNENDFLQKNY